MKVTFSSTALLLALLLCMISITAQNLVPNHNFEDFSFCPTNFGQMNAIGWYDPTNSSPDYYNVCGTPDVGVPENGVAFQESSSGSAYIGFFTYLLVADAREYVQVQLSSPLVAGSCYNLSITYSPTDVYGTSSGVGMYLSETAEASLVGADPQLYKMGAGETVSEWHTISTDYISLGGEEYLSLGNFFTDANTTFLPGSGASGAFAAYYFIDSVIVELVTAAELAVDIGPDLEICASEFPITLTSDQPNAINVWNTGEVSTSITVNSPGIYYVQSSIGCSNGVDSVNVLVFEEPDLVAEDINLCIGDNFLIELDPSLGEYLWEDGSSSSEYLVTEGGDYAVTLTYICGEIVDEFSVEVLSNIDIQESSDLNLCTTELPFLIDYSNYNDGNNEFLWQDGSSEAGFLVNSAGSYSVSIFNDCYSDEIELEVDISPSIPSFVNFSDTILCSGEEVVISTGLPYLDYAFLWQDGSTLPLFLAPSAGNYSVTVSNFCGFEIFDFEIDEAMEGNINIGEDVSICPGDSVLITADGHLSNVNWSNGSLGNSAWVKEEGQLIATAAGICGPISDTVNISFNGITPQIDIPDSLLVCSGDTISLSASDDISGIDFIWNTGEVGASISIYEAGTYVISGENSCGIVRDSVIVTLGESLPDPALEDSYEICAGDTIELQVEINAGTVIWSTGSTDPSIEVFNEGSYFVSLTNSCTTKEDSLTVIFTEELNPLDLGPDFGICVGDSMTIEAGTFNGSYSWNTGSEDEMITVNEVGFYSLQINGDCNSVSDTIEVTSLGTTPSIDLGEDISFCNGDSVMIDIGSVLLDELVWNNSSIENSITVFTAGTYFVVGSNVCGMDSDSIVVTIDNEVSHIDLGDDQQICPGDSVTLDVGNVTGGIIWNTGDEGNSIEVFDEGEYFVELTSSCGSSSDTILVEVLEAAPDVDLGIDQVLCFGESLDFDLLVGEETIILWNNGADTPDISFNQSALIWVSLSNACGTAGDSLVLQIIPEVSEVNMGDDVLLCDESSYFISPFVFDFNVDFEWNTGEMTEQLEVSETGEYWIEVSNECFVESDTILVIFGSIPVEFYLGDNDTICAGESIYLEEDQGTGFDYNWQDNSSNTAILATESGSYELVISNDCGMVSDKVDILVIPSEEIDVTLEENYLLCEDEPLEIDLSGIVADFIEWNDGSNEVFRLLTNPGAYEVKFENLCSDTLISFLFEQENCTENGAVFIPNTFTPNDDGVNDLFQIYINENWISPEVKVSIYNRWGEQVFYSEEVDFSWDGSFKNKSLNSGVYVYYIEISVEIQGEQRLIQETGDITIRN